MTLLFHDYEADFHPDTHNTRYKITKHYTQPGGLCFDIEDFDNFLIIGLYFDAKLYLVDPILDNLVYTGAHNMVGEPITVSKSSTGSYTVINVVVDIVKNVLSKDLSDCSDDSYNECLLDLISKDLLPDCLPPWITFNLDEQQKNVYNTCSYHDVINEKWSHTA